MAFVPIELSGLDYTFIAEAPVALVDSVVVSVEIVGNTWGLIFNDADQYPITVRITALSYTTDLDSGGAAYFTWLAEAGVQQIINVGGLAVFSPSPADALLDAPISGLTYVASAGSEGDSVESTDFLIEVEFDGPEPPAVVSYNCECEDNSGNRTLLELRSDLIRRLGYGAQVLNPPPGMADLLNSFLQGAQKALYRRYDVLRTERIYAWDLVEGVRYYDLQENSDVCTKRLDPRKVRWVGIERDGQWYPLICGISPQLYSHNPASSYPVRYEIRQCIEIWPAPDDTAAKLRIKGHFELEPFAVDGDQTTIDDELVFLLALANAKAHYGQPDANNYIGQLEVMMANLVAGSHHTRRYIPPGSDRYDMIYVAPKPTVPFPP